MSSQRAECVEGRGPLTNGLFLPSGENTHGRIGFGSGYNLPRLFNSQLKKSVVQQSPVMHTHVALFLCGGPKNIVSQLQKQEALD